MGDAAGDVLHPSRLFGVPRGQHLLDRLTLVARRSQLDSGAAGRLRQHRSVALDRLVIGSRGRTSGGMPFGHTAAVGGVTALANTGS